MSAEQNKALVRHMVDETFNQGNIGLFDEFLSPDFVEREVLPPGISSGREGVKQLTAMLHSAFPDFQATIEDIVAEGDKVVLRVAGGKCTEHWGQMDTMSLMQQLGAIPAPGQS
jgi:predicted ester cyclase